MADIIQLLPDHVANQIAAGEVVQRPSSVVKELLENAIDAGATSVKLIVKDAGRTLIQVVDNGTGMSATDARLSFERHATSKISDAEDLFRLHTKGFRGEALASIAAIAHVEMQTRQEAEELGTHLKLEGGKVVTQEMTVSPKGTSVAVKNLFFNIPARRNFLKSDQVELRHITDEFHRVALAHPAVEFLYYHNGSPLFNLKRTEPRKRIVQVFGRKTNEKLVPLSEDTQVGSISGFICKPQFAKKSRGEQFFFVNDRFIKCPFLHHAVVSAFEGLLGQDYYPGYFIYLEVEPSSIDINIHPTKTEIKFDDEQSLYAILRSAVKHSLGQFNIAPVLDFEKDQNLETPYHFRAKPGEAPRVTVDAGFNPFVEARGSLHSAGFSKPSTRGWEELYIGMKSEIGETSISSRLHPEPEEVNRSIIDSQEDQGFVTTFQLGNRYIVSTIKSGLLLIDQNRAHQRVLYEKFLKRLTEKETVSQQLLFPLKLSFTTSELQQLKAMADDLSTMGFDFDMEEEQLTVKGIPNLMRESDVGLVLDQLLATYQSGLEDKGYSQADVLAKALAKSLAVKPGVSLGAASQIALVNDLFACKELQLSPFNKVIFITVPEKDIAKKFE